MIANTPSSRSEGSAPPSQTMAAAMFWLWINRQPRSAEKSPLEQDIRDIVEAQKEAADDRKEMQRQLQDIRERVVRIETKQEGRAR